MARIFLSAISNNAFTKERCMDTFTQGFINALMRSGNNVLYYQANPTIIQRFSNAINPNFNIDNIIASIKDFNPDFVLSFNNVLPGTDFLDKIDCPIVVYPADLLIFWNDRSLIEQHLERYFFLTPNQTTRRQVTQTWQIDEKKIIPFGHVTDMRAEHLPQDIDISFVGSIANYSSTLIEKLHSIDKLDAPEEKNKIKDVFFTALDDFILYNDAQGINVRMDGLSQEVMDSEVILALTCKKRFATLSQLTDLKLKIFGYAPQWPSVFQYNYDLYRCFDYQPSVSYAQNKNTYNRSKISLNLPHGQNTNGFSWRVCDILASNALCLSNRKADLVELMEGYAELPMYESPAEARDLAQKLLKDDRWRKDLVQASQHMIEAKCRFERYFKGFEEHIPGLSLQGNNGTSLQLEVSTT